MVAAAVVGGAVIGAVGSNMAAGKAADGQKSAADKASATELEMFEQNRADLAPWRKAGGSALSRLQLMLGLSGNKNDANYGMLLDEFSGSDLQNDPGYQFMLAEGEKGINRAASANGMNLSGATLKALQKYGQGLASTSFGDAFNRDQARKGNIFGWLSGVSGTGQAATNQTGSYGAQYAANAGNNMMQSANVAGAARIGQANSIGNAINQGISAYTNPWYSQPTTSQFAAYDANGYGSAGSGASYGFGGGDFSDIRLKTNVRRIGISSKGYTRYRWDWRDGTGSAEGVIAQEVMQRDPSAVSEGAGGFLMVDYSRVH